MKKPESFTYHVPEIFALLAGAGFRPEFDDDPLLLAMSLRLQNAGALEFLLDGLREDYVGADWLGAANLGDLRFTAVDMPGSPGSESPILIHGGHIYDKGRAPSYLLLRQVAVRPTSSSFWFIPVSGASLELVTAANLTAASVVMAGQVEHLPTSAPAPTFGGWFSHFGPDGTAVFHQPRAYGSAAED